MTALNGTGLGRSAFECDKMASNVDPGRKGAIFGAEEGTRDSAAVGTLPRMVKGRGRTRRRFHLVGANEIAARPLPPYRIKDVLPMSGIALVYGPSGSGKSFLILDAIAKIAAGKPWFGHKTTPCPAVYVALEGVGGISQRLRAYRKVHGFDALDGVSFLTDQFSLMNESDVDALAEEIIVQALKAGIVVIDTLNAGAPGADENSSNDMGRIIEGAKRLQKRLGALVVLVHHTGKDDARGPRGHSSLVAAVDASIEVKRSGAQREWMQAKLKDGTDGARYGFRLTAVELGKDEDGMAVSSCTVEPAELSRDAPSRASQRPKGQQLIALRVITDLLKTAPLAESVTAASKLPPGRPFVLWDDAQREVARAMPVEAKRQNERAKGAITGLVSKRLLAVQDGVVWKP